MRNSKGLGARSLFGAAHVLKSRVTYFARQHYRRLLTVLLVLPMPVAALWWGCSDDRAVAPRGEQEFFGYTPEPGLRLGPIEGITTAWHIAPKQFVVPRGVDVQFRCPVPLTAQVRWTGATEIARDNDGSTASCPTSNLGTQRVEVEVIPPPPGKDGDPRKPRETVDAMIYACEFQVVHDFDSSIRVSQPRVSRPPLFVSESASNWELLKHYQSGSIAAVHEVASGKYVTAVESPIQFSANVQPAIFAALVEWRFNGEAAMLGGSASHALTRPGEYVVEVGPPGKGPRFVVEAYRVVTVGLENSSRDGVLNGAVATFAAHTDPAGFEGYVTWLAATRFGTAAPVLGRGGTFTVQFDEIVGQDENGRAAQWMGVRADNATFATETFLACYCPPNAPAPSLQLKDTQTSLYPDPAPPPDSLSLPPVATITAELKGPGAGECCLEGAKWQMVVVASSAIPGGNSGTTALFLCGEGPFSASTLRKNGPLISACPVPAAAGCPPAPPAPSTRTATCEVPVACDSNQSPWPCGMPSGPYITILELGAGGLAGRVEVHWTASLGATQNCVMTAPTGDITGVYHLRVIGGVWNIYDPFHDDYIPNSGPGGDCDLDGVSNYEEVIAGTDPGDCPDDEGPSAMAW